MGHQKLSKKYTKWQTYNFCGFFSQNESFFLMDACTKRDEYMVYRTNSRHRIKQFDPKMLVAISFVFSVLGWCWGLQLQCFHSWGDLWRSLHLLNTCAKVALEFSRLLLLHHWPCCLCGLQLINPKEVAVAVIYCRSINVSNQSNLVNLAKWCT